MAILYIPIYELDHFDYRDRSQNFYLISELFNVFVIVECLVVLKMVDKKNRAPMFSLKFASSLVVFFACNYLQYVSYDISKNEINAHTDMYKIWAYASLCKIAGVHNLMKYSSRWISIISAIKQVVPMVKDLLMMYLVILLSFGTLGVYFYGGQINSNSNALYKKYTGGDISDNYIRLNFNDIVGSILFMLVSSFCADSLSLYKMVIANSNHMVATGIFFAAFYFIGLLIVLNIILGTILGFITTYLGITEEEEMEKQKTKVGLWNRIFNLKANRDLFYA